MQTKTVVVVHGVFTAVLRGGIEIYEDNGGITITHKPYIGQRAYLSVYQKPDRLEVETF